MNLEMPTPFPRTAASGKLAALAVTCLLTAPAQAQTQMSAEPASGPAPTVIAVVKVPKPWYAPRAVVVGKMREAIAQYSRLPGLSFKAFSFARDGGDYGGLYCWQDAASAKAWFNPAWFERVRQERGAEGQVRYFDALVSIDNTPGGTPLNTDSASVATLVEIPIPAGVSRERLFAEFKAAVPVYQKVPGLLRKHFTVSASGSFGGLYIWKDEASATAWFNSAWQDRVRKTYGSSAKIEWFDTPILMPAQRSSSDSST
jgi:heme-degrading monooxygenase HmoA